MSYLRFERIWPVLAVVALLLGVWSGRRLKAGGSGSRHEGVPAPVTTEVRPAREEPVKPAGKKRRLDGDRDALVAEPGQTFLVDGKVLEKLRLNLLDGTKLNRDECRLLGLSDEQMGKLERVVTDSVKRWEEREKAAVRVISEEDGVMRMYIPPTDPKVAEQEWEEVRAKVDEIAGPALREAFRRQLTDGYSPTFLSTLGMGKLNILTAGFGTMDRFIEAKKQADGQLCYQVYDVMPDRREGAPIDAAQFEKFAGGNGYDQQQSLSLEKNAEQLAHLPLPKER